MSRNVKRGPAQTEMTFRTHGGRRAGAGRRRREGRTRVGHGPRPFHHARHPLHVTVRIVDGLPSLRDRDFYHQLRASTIVTARREDFRIVHLSIQRNHLHLIVEAQDARALSKGMQGFGVSAAKRINHTIGRRTGTARRGKVLDDRYHARPLTCPRAVRHCIAYVLNNWRKHGEDRADHVRHMNCDPFSSGAVFPDWKELEHTPFMWPLPPTYHPLFVWRPRTWLLAVGWKLHHPLISCREVPAGSA